MAARNLNNRHPEYTETEDARTKSRVLFGGGDRFKDADPKGTTYLLKEPNEPDDAYLVRRKRATMDNFIEKIVMARQAFLFKDEHTRDLPASMKQYLDDVNMKNVAADVFFAGVAESAQVDGIAWVAVDMPALPEGQKFASKGAEQDADHRPFFTFIPGKAVVDWEVGDDGKLLWLVIAQSQPVPRDRAGDPKTSVPQWKIWYRDRWELWAEKSKASSGSAPSPGATDNYRLEAEGKNPTKVVPVVPFWGFRNTDYSGWPVVISVLNHIILLLNKQSELDRIERLKTEPIPYAIGPKKPVKIKATGGIWLDSSGIGNTKIELGFLEVSGSGLDHNRQSIESLKAAIVSIALAQAKKDSAQVQSADGQREDRRTFTSSLKSNSRSYERAETLSWQIWGLWSSETQEPKIGYARDFVDGSIDSAMLGVLNTLADSHRLTDKTLLDLLQRSGLLPSTLDIEKELATLDALKKEEEAKEAANLMGTEPSEPTEEQSGDATP